MGGSWELLWHRGSACLLLLVFWASATQMQSCLSVQLNGIIFGAHMIVTCVREKSGSTPTHRVVFFLTSLSKVIVIELEIYYKCLDMCVTDIIWKRNQSKIRIYTVQKHSKWNSLVNIPFYFYEPKKIKFSNERGKRNENITSFYLYRQPLPVVCGCFEGFPLLWCISFNSAIRNSILEWKSKFCPFSFCGQFLPLK